MQQNDKTCIPAFGGPLDFQHIALEFVENGYD
jgi:hypothetical protein